MKKNLLYIFLLMFLSQCVFSQSIKQHQKKPVKSTAKEKKVKVTMSIGDTIHIGKCPGGESYKFIDVYTKTRIPDTTITFNEETGDGLFEYFFMSGGDLDGKRLSCFYQGDTFIIAAAHELKDKDTGLNRIVVFAWLDRRKLQLLWIEIQKATDAEEISVNKK